MANIQKYEKYFEKHPVYFIYFHINQLIFRSKTQETWFQVLSEKPVGKENNYWTRVNLRLNPKFVFEVGKVFATNGLFIV